MFTDNKFHSIGIGFNKLSKADQEAIGYEFLKSDYSNATVDIKVLTDPKTSEVGRLAVSKKLYDRANFKTPTLRNINLTAPYMHDGSRET